VLILSALAGAVSGRAAKMPSTQPAVRGHVLALARAYEAAHRATVGLSVVDLRSGAKLVSLRDDERMVPASNQKVLTSAFALARLGGKFQFVTRAYLAGGSLWVVGSGDPTLGDPRLAKEAGKSIYAELDRWAAAVRKRVGPALQGDLIAVPSFDGRSARLESFRHADWPRSQYHRWYLAPVAGLSFHNNCFDVTYTLRSNQVTPHVHPQSRWIRIVNKVRRARKHLWSLTSNADDSVVTLRGTIRQTTRDPISVPVNDPPLLFARVLADRLERAGVAVGGAVRVAAAAPQSVVADELEVCRTVTPLSVAMLRANKRSLNTAAECLFLRAGDGTWAGSAKQMTQTLVKSYDLSPADLVVRDGCGLSHGNRVTPRALTAMLRQVAGRPDGGVFVQSLARSGVDGTLARRMTGKATRGRVLGKSGYVAGVSCLSGYVLDARGKPALAYAILVNRTPTAWRAKYLQDRICSILVTTVEEQGAGAP
jgi:D-alanyl-D-alanine carboxypeptidase/D-alanyl-D-alanine-endopeptidase (penicillin-binding protein 4)